MDKRVTQKLNYQVMLDELLEGLEKRPSLLLHSCCGPCSSYCLDYLKDYFDITVLYYNPNIFPEEEYIKRLDVQKSLIDSMNCEFNSDIKLIDVPYNHDEFLSVVSGLEDEPEGGKRCTQCFNLRLGKTADIARENGFDYFGTTLSVSPHKNAILLNEIGASLEYLLATPEDLVIGKTVNASDTSSSLAPKWLFADFKKKEGYKKSIELSKKYNLYRQDYCGCEFAKNPLFSNCFFNRNQ